MSRPFRFRRYILPASGALMALGGTLVIVGSFLPWMTLFAGLHPYPGIDGLFGQILAGTGVLVVLCGALMVVRRWSEETAVVGAMLGAGIVLFTTWILMGLDSTLAELRAQPMLVAESGPGLAVVLKGGLIVVIGALMSLTADLPFSSVQEVSMRPRTSFLRLPLSLLAGVFLLTACDPGSSPLETELDPDLSAHANHNARGDGERGTTAGWFKGETVTFSYLKDFFCEQPPSSEADSGCALGAEPETAPRPGRIPIVYVMTPIGFRPDEATLHCPVVGECINHPSTIDLSRVFGMGTENAALPAHSHIVDELQGNWWEIEVIGVTEPSVWAEVVAGRSLDRVRELQDAGIGITGDIPTNLYLFFNVQIGQRGA